MSSAKERMRNKKLKNQPSSVTYSSPGVGSGSSHCRNGGEGPSHGRGHDPSPARDRGSSHPIHGGGWVRGHQRDGKAYGQELPKAITASGFIKARAAEVTAMLKAVNKTTGSVHAFGVLPKHMRRRAMSHNTKRLPCRLREVANRMLEKSQKLGQKEKKPQSKTKSRKARRRHGNLLLDFNRRQRKNVWLETHIWHAKRFHMAKRWGYCLGERPTYKCYRACYRAMSSHCLLQDLSYHCCLELRGEEGLLLAALAQLTCKDSGPTFAAAASLSGRRQGSTLVYRAGQAPAQPLGPVLFLWRPRTQDSTQRQLWLWIHPTLKQDLLPELRAVCQCSEAVPPPPTLEEMPPAPAPAPPSQPPPGPAQAPGPDTETKGPQPDGTKASKRKRSQGETETTGPPAKKVLGDGTRSPTTPVTWRSSTTGIVLSDLTMEIVRYRLIGPLSHSVLTETLEAATECDASSPSQQACLWWPEHCKDEGNMSLHRKQADIFNLLKGVYSTAEVPSGSVLGLTVDDPRLTLPRIRGKAMPSIQQAQEVDEESRRELMLRGVPEGCSQSPLWERSVRDDVTDHKTPEQELNRMRSEVLVPGSRLQPLPQGRVPVLLVQQPGKQAGQEQASWGVGWDLLLPKAWGMAFWVPLVYRGVRVGGLNMALKHSQNKGAPHFPHDYPDCPAGKRFQEEQEEELLAKFKRRPPAKRTNYIKHGCLAPFRCPWQQLAEEWELIVREEAVTGGEEAKGGGSSESLAKLLVPKAGEVTSQVDVAFTILRNRKSLRLLSSWCRPTSSKGQRSQRQWAVPPLNPAVAASLLASNWRSLVWVRLSLLSKGQPELHAQVCVPAPEDLRRQRGQPSCSGPLEPLHTDHFRSKLKQLKKHRKAKPTSSSSHKSDDKQSGSAPISASTSTPGPDTSSAPTIHSTPGPPSLSAPTPLPSITLPAPSLTPPSSSQTSDLTLGLWPEPLPSVSSHCSRVTLGWVSQGDFSLVSGCGEALGLVSLPGLLHMLLGQPEDQRGLVLLRNPSSLQYRLAKVNIEV
ncbi:ribonucleases P/MRP protein subunit POP1 [Osmerus mordax]|uniref:ribonucleases P/MRP protein subunit POP1 n=1 Tax=Osmerus mordax TaxID=8014 RepID=UPI003510CC83